MAKKHKTIAILLAASASIFFVVCLIIWRRPIAIKYHKQRMKALLNRKPEFDPVVGLSFFGDDWIEAFEEHRDKLVELGYLQRKEFPLSTIKTPSLRFRRLWEELGARFPDNPYTQGDGYESDTPAIIVVWDEQDDLAEWERIISAHDAPRTNIVYVGQQEDVQKIAPFLGSWANEEGEVCYIITEDTEGNVKIETPPNEVLRTEFRSVRFDGSRILLDQFNHMDPNLDQFSSLDPNEDYKLPIDMSGEHPFSGVRCETVLEVNSKNPDELFESMSSFYLTDPATATLRRLE